MVAIAILLGVLAYRAKSWALGVLAFLALGVANPVMFLTVNAFLFFPVLLIATVRGRGVRYFLLLVATLILTPALVYWRIPRPAPAPSEPTREAVATIRRLETVKDVWVSEESGQNLPHPFLLIELEFTPAGTVAPVRVVDRLDTSGLSGLHPGTTLPVLYSAADPTAACVKGGTHTYVGKAMRYLLGWSYVLGAGFAVFLVIIGGMESIGRRLFGHVTDPVQRARQMEALEQRIGSLPPDDPRRKKLEGFFRSEPRE